MVFSMSGREDRIRAEARDLWAATHQGPPPPIDGQALLDLILSDCAAAGYDRLHSQHLRPGQVVQARYEPPSRPPSSLCGRGWVRPGA
jgi:hypothetical protein